MAKDKPVNNGQLVCKCTNDDVIIGFTIGDLGYNNISKSSEFQTLEYSLRNVVKSINRDDNYYENFEAARIIPDKGKIRFKSHICDIQSHLVDYYINDPNVFTNRDGSKSRVETSYGGSSRTFHTLHIKL